MRCGSHLFVSYPFFLGGKGCMVMVAASSNARDLFDKMSQREFTQIDPGAVHWAQQLSVGPPIALLLLGSHI